MNPGDFLPCFVNRVSFHNGGRSEVHCSQRGLRAFGAGRRLLRCRIHRVSERLKALGPAVVTTPMVPAHRMLQKTARKQEALLCALRTLVPCTQQHPSSKGPITLVEYKSINSRTDRFAATIRRTSTRVHPNDELLVWPIAVCCYRFLPDGQVFDASNAPGRKPIAFKLGARQVIKGWEEVLRLMNVRISYV